MGAAVGVDSWGLHEAASQTGDRQTPGLQKNEMRPSALLVLRGQWTESWPPLLHGVQFLLDMRKVYRAGGDER